MTQAIDQTDNNHRHEWQPSTSSSGTSESSPISTPDSDSPTTRGGTDQPPSNHPHMIPVPAHLHWLHVPFSWTSHSLSHRHPSTSLLASRFHAVFQQWQATPERAQKRAALARLPTQLLGSLEAEYCFGLGSFTDVSEWPMGVREETRYWQLAQLVDDGLFFQGHRVRQSEGRWVRPFKLYAQDPAFSDRDVELLEHLHIYVSRARRVLLDYLNPRAVYFAPHLDPNVETAWVFDDAARRPAILLTTLVLSEEAVSHHHEECAGRYVRNHVNPVLQNYDEVAVPEWSQYRGLNSVGSPFFMAMWYLRIWVSNDMYRDAGQTSEARVSKVAKGRL